MKETAIYVHIPFCDHKCIYCDFYSIVSYDNLNNYLSAIKKEIEFYAERERKNREIISIFFGGGTPSFVEPEYIGEIITAIKEQFNVRESAEITLETNPGTVDKEKIKKFINAGINRISIGIQSFNEDELKFLTRIHNKENAIRTVYYAGEAGLENISIDLIFNLPKQTKEKWKFNLDTAFTLPIKKPYEFLTRRVYRSLGSHKRSARDSNPQALSGARFRGECNTILPALLE